MTYNCQACEQRADDNDFNTIVVNDMRFHWGCFADDLDENDIALYVEEYGYDRRMRKELAWRMAASKK